MDSRTLIWGISGVVVGLTLAAAQAGAGAQTAKGGKKAAALPKPLMDAKHEVWTVEKGGEWKPFPDLFPPGPTFKVIHGDPAKEAADFYVKLPAGYAVPLHLHTANERVFMSDGRLEVFGMHGGAEAIQAGGFTFMPARMPHRVTCASKTDCTLYLSSDGPFDIYLVDEKGNVGRGWSVAAGNLPVRQ